MNENKNPYGYDWEEIGSKDFEDLPEEMFFDNQGNPIKKTKKN